jgi:hypothetical protein
LQKSIVVKAVFINLFDIFTKNKVVKPSIRPDIQDPPLPDTVSGIRLFDYPKIRPAGYPAKQYPAHPYFPANESSSVLPWVADPAVLSGPGSEFLNYPDPDL